MSRRHIIIIASVTLAIMLIGAVTVSRMGRKSVGVSELQIPPETKAYLEQLAQKVGDLVFSRKEGSGKDRTNKEDDEQADARGFKKVWSENFIVYYQGSERERAREILDYSEASKPRMEYVLNHFPHARNKNGRRLPIYLASSEKQYYELSKVPFRSIACVTTEVYDDALVSTMHVSPAIFAAGVRRAQQTIAHEVAHYTHFDLVALNNIRNQRAWFTEGLASYAAEQEERLTHLRDAYRANKIIPLTELSSYSDSQAYGSPNIQLIYCEGHSVLQMIENRHGRQRLVELVDAVSRKTDIGGATAGVLNISLGELNQVWLGYLASLYQAIGPDRESLGGGRFFLALFSRAMLPNRA